MLQASYTRSKNSELTLIMLVWAIAIHVVATVRSYHPALLAISPTLPAAQRRARGCQVSADQKGLFSLDGMGEIPGTRSSSKGGGVGALAG